MPVRLQSEDVVRDVFGAQFTLHDIMKQMGDARRGVIVYLREGSVGVTTESRSARQLVGEGEHHDEARDREAEWREIGLGAQILRDLGISSIRLLASRRRHYVGLEGFGIAITATDIIDAS